MSKSEYILPIPETVAMTQTAADALISSGRGDAALLYIYILRNKGYFSEDAARENWNKTSRWPARRRNWRALG